MTLLNAIAAADAMRPNDIPNDVKASWVYAFEAGFADLMGEETPVNPFPGDGELLVPAPYDGLYVTHLAANIDHYLQDFSLYANDAALANKQEADFRALYRRQNVPEITKINRNWRTM